MRRATILNLLAGLLGWVTVAAAGEILAREGQGRLEQVDGHLVLHLAGTPAEMGRQHGVLLRPHVRAVVDRLLYGVGFAKTMTTGQPFLRDIQDAWRRLQPHIPPDHIAELDALADGAQISRTEARLGNVFPELFHCSGFVLFGNATKDGALYHGRVLDYMVGVGLDKHAVVIVSRPAGAYAWVNISYAGFTGSVTAMNEHHLAIGEMGGRGEGDWDGLPMAQLVRRVMEKAATLAEAVAIMRDTPRTCEYYYVISDGKSGQAVGIYATPTAFETVAPGAGHPKLPTPVADTVLFSAGSRYEELVRRVQAGYGQFDAAAAVELMKRPVAMQSNLHSVLFAPATLDLWVANARGANPACDQPYTRYNLADLLGRTVSRLANPQRDDYSAGRER